MQGLETPRWASAHLIGLTQKLNEQGLGAVREWAKEPRESAPPFVAKNRDLWVQLDTEARRRIAALPFAIVEVDLSGERKPEAVGIPVRLAQDLLFETLLLARQIAREDLNAAKVIFGVTDAVALAFAAVSMQQVRSIALNDTPCLRIRFDDPQLWRELLTTAQAADGAALAELYHHAKLLFRVPSIAENVCR